MPNFSDNLDGTSGSLLSARTGWATGLGGNTGSDAILATGGSGFALAGATGAEQTISPSSQPSSPDQFAQCLMPTVNAFSYPLGVRVSAGTTFGGYFLRRGNATSTGLILARRSTSALTSTAFVSLGTGNATNGTSPFKLVAQGNQIWVEQDGSILIGPVTDSNFTSGSVGCLSRAATPSASANRNFDEWLSGNLAAGTEYALAAATASFALIGKAASLPVARKIAADVAALGMSGLAAAVSVRRAFAASPGSWSMAGRNASMRLARMLAGARADVTLTGRAARLAAARRLVAGSSVFATSFRQAGIATARRLIASVGALTVTGLSIAWDIVTGAVGPVPANRTLIVPQQLRAIEVPRQDRTIVL